LRVLRKVFFVQVRYGIGGFTPKLSAKAESDEMVWENEARPKKLRKNQVNRSEEFHYYAKKDEIALDQERILKCKSCKSPLEDESGHYSNECTIDWIPGDLKEKYHGMCPKCVRHSQIFDYAWPKRIGDATKIGVLFDNVETNSAVISCPLRKLRR
jgi:hypothetical protein